MATPTVNPPADGLVLRAILLDLIRKIFHGVVAIVRDAPVARLRHFLWLASGMFSASALSLAFLGYFAMGTIDDATHNFAAAVVAGILFAAATILKLGPESS